MDDLVNKVRGMALRAQQSDKRRNEPTQQMPLWAERTRALPNPLARCALFTASGPKETRRRFARDIIASVQGVSILYTGEELRQDDQDVFLQLVHIGRAYTVGDEFMTTGGAILTALGWGRGKEKYARLKQSIGRLVEGTVWVSTEDGTTGFTGRLIGGLEWADETSDGVHAKWKFRLEKKVVQLFGADAFSLVDWEQRLSLSPLEKWLHSFYVTHRSPYPYKVETIYTLCGSKVKQLRQFRYMLKAALENLRDVGFLESHSIDPNTDLVSVKRKLQTPLIA
jgi:hypothetical protein